TRTCILSVRRGQAHPCWQLPLTMPARLRLQPLSHPHGRRRVLHPRHTSIPRSARPPVAA
ncbi:hypothetical protein BD626DRAFT_523473, partial [Schizophyllum amplum]